MAVTTTINPTSDNWLNEGSATTNYGSASTFQAGVSGGTMYKKHAVLEFDVSSLTNPADITSANLTLVATSSGGGGSNNMTLQRLTQSFGETTSNWNTYDGSNSWTTVGAFDDVVAGEPTYTISVGATSDVVVDVRELVIDAINRRSGILRIVIYFDGTPSNGGFTRFGARNHGTASNHPKVEVVTARRAVWTGAIDGDLDTSGNWEDTISGEPSTSDIAIFSGGANVTRGTLACAKAYLSEGFENDIGTSASSVSFTVSEIHINKKLGKFFIDCSGKPTVFIANTSADTNGSKLLGTYEPIIKNTRSEIYLAGTGGDTVICASESSVKARGATACDSINNGGRYVAEDGCNDTTIASGAKFKSEGGTFADIFIAGDSYFNHRAGTLGGDLVIYNGKVDFKNNESAVITTEDVTIYRNGIFDARTSTGSHDGSSEIMFRGGNFILDVGKTITIT